MLEYTPNVDGRTLDNVIDFFTYVAVPALMVYWFNMTPVDFIFSGQTWSLISAAAIMAVSCYTFANVGMKSDDYYFVGFPAVWNVVVLYFFVLQSGPIANLVTIVLLCVLTFIPIKFVHPLRVTDWREITIPMTVLWAAMSLSLILASKDRSDWNIVEDVQKWVWLGASRLFLRDFAVAHLHEARGRRRPRCRGRAGQGGLTSPPEFPYIATLLGGVAQLVRARES